MSDVVETYVDESYLEPLDGGSKFRIHLSRHDTADHETVSSLLRLAKHNFERAEEHANVEQARRQEKIEAVEKKLSRPKYDIERAHRNLDAAQAKYDNLARKHKELVDLYAVLKKNYEDTKSELDVNARLPQRIETMLLDGFAISEDNIVTFYWDDRLDRVRTPPVPPVRTAEDMTLSPDSVVNEASSLPNASGKILEASKRQAKDILKNLRTFLTAYVENKPPPKTFHVRAVKAGNEQLWQDYFQIVSSAPSELAKLSTDVIESLIDAESVAQLNASLHRYDDGDDDDDDDDDEDDDDNDDDEDDDDEDDVDEID